MDIKSKYILVGMDILITSSLFFLLPSEPSSADRGFTIITNSEKLQYPMQIALAYKEGTRVIFLSPVGNKYKGIIINANLDNTFTIQDIGGTTYYRVPLAAIIGTWSP